MPSKQTFTIITGSPGTGKSSIINELKSRGRTCYPEIARQVIKEHQEKSMNIFPWNRMDEFSDEVYKRMKVMLKEITVTHCFLDRSIIDLIGYMKFSGFIPPEKYKIEALMQPYLKQVFYAPVWEEIYGTDEERKESINQAILIDQALRSAYNSLGFELIEIPKTIISERADFILNFLKTNRSKTPFKATYQ